jgi:endonuclease/exonuclease/phosphatase family metal-dependent hydrolase
MKKKRITIVRTLLLGLCLTGLVAFAKDYYRIHTNDASGTKLLASDEVDSVKIAGSNVNFYEANAVTYSSPLAGVDSITFIQDASGAYSTMPVLSGSAPCEFYALDFDLGGEGVAYHDESSNNEGGGSYRNAKDPGCSVDHWGNSVANGIGWFKETEWLVYTLNVQDAGDYRIEINAKNGNQISSYHLEIDGVNITGTMYFPMETEEWLDTKLSVTLSAGIHQFKFHYEYPCCIFDLKGFRFTYQPELSIPETAMKVMTFNIHVYSGQNDAPVRWDDGRKVLVRRTIIENEADIVGTQETELTQQNYLKDNLPGYQSIGVTNSAGGNNGESNSIFFKQARFELLESGKFWLSATPNVAGSKSWDSGYIRMAVWAKLKDKTNDRQYFFINSHIDHLGMTAQQKQVEVLLQKIGELRGSLPVILTGDFNMRPNNSNIAVVTNSFLAHARDVAQTITGLNYSYYGYGRTPINERYLADYIFVNDDVDVYRYSVLPGKLDGNYVSDHAPIIAIF